MLCKCLFKFRKLDIKFEEGDYIFPYEGDVFHHEDDADNIRDYMRQIEPGQGFRSIWIDYLKLWYVEKMRIKPYLVQSR